MSYIAVTCPSCGAAARINESKDFGFCEYCGSRIEKEKVIIEHKGKVSVSGIADEKSLLERAFIFIEDGEYDNADIYIERVLDSNPKYSKAYIAKLLCQLKLHRVDDLAILLKPLNKYEWFEKAKKYATNEELVEYEMFEDRVFDRIKEAELVSEIEYNNTKRKNEEEKSKLEKEKTTVEREIDNLSKKIKTDKFIKIIHWIVIIVSSLTDIFTFALGCSYSGDVDADGFDVFMFVVSAIFAGVIVIGIVNISKIKKRKNKLDSARTEYNSLSYKIKSLSNIHKSNIIDNYKDIIISKDKSIKINREDFDVVAFFDENDKSRAIKTLAEFGLNFDEWRNI